MFFFLSKVLFFLVTPSNVCWFLIASGLAMAARARWQWFGLRLAASGLVLLLVLGFSPLGLNMLMALEGRFAPANRAFSERVAAAGRIDGIILLGGFEDGRISAARGQLAVNESGERLIETVQLARAFDGVPIIFTGGAGGVIQSYQPAGDYVRSYLVSVGIDPARIIVEGRSLNTWQNAVFTREALGAGAQGKRYLLVTAAWHMPRSVGVFRQAGFDVVAWPADFRTVGRGDRWRFSAFIWTGLAHVDIAAKEFIGLAAYRVTGRSSALWPAP